MTLCAISTFRFYRGRAVVNLISYNAYRILCYQFIMYCQSPGSSGASSLRKTHYTGYQIRMLDNVLFTKPLSLHILVKLWKQDNRFIYSWIHWFVSSSSTSSNSEIIQSTTTAPAGDKDQLSIQAFSITAPTVWNICLQLRTVFALITTFKAHLKTELSDTGAFELSTRHTAPPIK